MKINATYTPNNDPATPWLAGELTTGQAEYSEVGPNAIWGKPELDSYKIPVFYVGNNDNYILGQYDRKESWFPRSLKGDIALKKGSCFQLKDICINGIPFFIRQNTSGTQYLSNKDDTISLVYKKDGAKDGDYTITLLQRLDTGTYLIKNIGILYSTWYDVKKEIPFPYYNHEDVKTIYTALKEELSTCEEPDLCRSFTKRKGELVKYKESLLGGSRRKKRTYRKHRKHRKQSKQRTHRH